MAKNKDTGVIADEIEDTDSEPRVYELGFHLDPELPVEEVKKIYKTFHDMIALKGAIVAEVEPEKIPLAYTISRQEVAGRRDFDSAYFSWIVYETSAVPHAEILAMLKAGKHVVRFIDLVTTKDAARHALETHELSKKVAPVESALDAEEVLSAEIDVALESAAL